MTWALSPVNLPWSSQIRDAAFAVSLDSRNLQAPSNASGRTMTEPSAAHNLRRLRSFGRCAYALDRAGRRGSRRGNQPRETCGQRVELRGLDLLGTGAGIDGKQSLRIEAVKEIPHLVPGAHPVPPHQVIAQAIECIRLLALAAPPPPARIERETEAPRGQARHEIGDRQAHQLHRFS